MIFEAPNNPSEGVQLSFSNGDACPPSINPRTAQIQFTCSVNKSFTFKQTKQNKTKQNKTKQNKTKQNKTKQNKTKQNKTIQNKSKQNKTKQNK